MDLKTAVLLISFGLIMQMLDGRQADRVHENLGAAAAFFLFLFILFLWILNGGYGIGITEPEIDRLAQIKRHDGASIEEAENLKNVTGAPDQQDHFEDKWESWKKICQTIIGFLCISGGILAVVDISISISERHLGWPTLVWLILIIQVLINEILQKQWLFYFPSYCHCVSIAEKLKNHQYTVQQFLIFIALGFQVIGAISDGSNSSRTSTDDFGFGIAALVFFISALVYVLFANYFKNRSIWAFYHVILVSCWFFGLTRIMHGFLNNKNRFFFSWIFFFTMEVLASIAIFYVRRIDT